ncbi:amidohydrolase family protein [Ornithinimicrobium sp. INDO-MA30-4]|uniref:amidohydrolase family protein n=1 Tax=Ornithinimicrobium sp. INDO-MA30-4 TaxID=2908651 RepID=UPI001F1643CE|nr:amidohydrolase family protein [Ornithinimicrobium sp. INDO-MA30-4]UJH69595.1 amidohydrolase family protein [Ornithinimicrobium sp. INDO-MA30-4]
MIRSALRANASTAYPLVCASALMSSTPAKALGLGEVGELTPGQWADLVVWDDVAEQVAGMMSHGEWVVGPYLLTSKALKAQHDLALITGSPKAPSSQPQRTTPTTNR